jgi:hypothetical protein
MTLEEFAKKGGSVPEKIRIPASNTTGKNK